MKKKVLLVLLASMGVLACTVGASAVAITGANQLASSPVKADPTEYSVTFNESNTTVKEVDGDYAISTTTAAGNKVGVVGWDKEEACFTFRNASFHHLMLSHYDVFGEDEGAYPFRTITGFAISFSVEQQEEEPMPISVDFSSMETMIHHITSGQEYKGLSIAPDDSPTLMPLGEVNITISSLTIWYSC